MRSIRGAHALAWSPAPLPHKSLTPHDTADRHWSDPRKRKDSGLIKSGVKMERATGIEPASEAWEASILPMNYARNSSSRRNRPVDHSVTMDGHATGVSHTVLRSRHSVLCDGGCRAALGNKAASAHARTPVQRGDGSAHRSCRSSRLAVRYETLPVLLRVPTADTLRIA